MLRTVLGDTNTTIAPCIVDNELKKVDSTKQEQCKIYRYIESWVVGVDHA